MPKRSHRRRRGPPARATKPARAAAGALSFLFAACGTEPAQRAGAASTPAPASRVDEREAMVRDQIQTRGVRDPLVLAAMRAVPRHEFVPAGVRHLAYLDSALPIEHRQTISQPYIVAFMTDVLQLRGGEKVLEIGTGSGYQAAVLAALGCEVFSIEIVAPLAESAAANLRRTGYTVKVRAGDGYLGWPEEAPFDAVIVTAAPDHVPQPLLDQLREGGRMVLPVGDAYQELVLLEKTATGVSKSHILPVRFVPMTGKAQDLDR